MQVNDGISTQYFEEWYNKLCIRIAVFEKWWQNMGGQICPKKQIKKESPNSNLKSKN